VDEFFYEMFKGWDVSLAKKIDFGADPDHYQDLRIFNGTFTIVGIGEIVRILRRTP